jgi:biofilm PGA synthesis N-glycosyltransferase PgaC
MNEILEIAAVPATNKQTLSYVLITPARNEEAYIAQTLKSVTSQTVLPLRWVIVSDGSTDRTDAIVSKYATEHSWIELLRMPERTERHFAGKVYAFNAGLDRVKHLDYDIIGNLDADVSFEPDYLEYLLEKFESMPKLGVAGTNRWEGTVMYDYRVSNIDDVAGACQLFRRECFEAIGGYKPVKTAGSTSLRCSAPGCMDGRPAVLRTGYLFITARPARPPQAA